MVRVVVLAVPGGGKSTTLQLLRKLRPEVRVVNFGDVMFEVAKRVYGIHDRDEMRKKLTLSDYRRLQELAAEEIGRIDGVVLIDTHAAIKTPYGYFPGIPEKVIKLMKPDAIVLLEFDPEIVLERRLKDLEKGSEITEVGTVRQLRKRDIESLDDIEQHQEIAKYFATAASVLAGCPLYIINLRGVKQNMPFDHALIAAKLLSDLLTHLTGGRGNE